MYLIHNGIRIKEVRKLTTRVNIKKSWFSVFSLFIAIVGGAEILVLFLSGFRLFPLGVLGALSILSVYGFIRMKKWSIWFVVAHFLLGTTFGATTLYASVMIQTFHSNLSVFSFNLILIAYLIITIFSAIFIVAKRGEFLANIS